MRLPAAIFNRSDHCGLADHCGTLDPRPADEAGTRTEENRTMATAPEPATPAPTASTALDLAKLALGAVAVKAMPKPQRPPSGTDRLAELVRKSYTEHQIFELPAVAIADGADAGKVTATLVAAVRRAASHAGLGVSVGHEVTEKGVVVTFKGKRKR
jgi:hypothetical protein